MGAIAPARVVPKVGKPPRCPCGSGQPYGPCHGRRAWSNGRSGAGQRPALRGQGRPARLRWERLLDGARSRRRGKRSGRRARPLDDRGSRGLEPARG